MKSLSLPTETYYDFFQLSFIQKSLIRHAINLIIYDPNNKEITEWKSYSIIDK